MTKLLRIYWGVEMCNEGKMTGLGSMPQLPTPVEFGIERWASILEIGARAGLVP